MTELKLGAVDKVAPDKTPLQTCTPTPHAPPRATRPRPPPSLYRATARTRLTRAAAADGPPGGVRRVAAPVRGRGHYITYMFFKILYQLLLL
jgi:hypothetical protein